MIEDFVFVEKLDDPIDLGILSEAHSSIKQPQPLTIENNDEEECKDNCTVYGFLSQMAREEVRKFLSMEELVEMMSEEDKFKNVDESIKAIDIDRTGFVTSGELNNCFKENYDKKLWGRSLVKAFRPFASM